MDVNGFLEWLAKAYLIPPNKLNVVGLTWILIIFGLSFKNLKKDLGETNDLKKLFRIGCLSFLLSFFVHLFYDLWAYTIYFFFGNTNTVTIPAGAMANRLARDLIQLAVLYYIFSSPDWSRDFPSLHEIKIQGNKKFYVLNVIILVWHVLLLYHGFFGLPFLEKQVIRFYTGYMPMKILWALSYWSIWK